MQREVTAAAMMSKNLAATKAGTAAEELVEIEVGATMAASTVQRRRLQTKKTMEKQRRTPMARARNTMEKP